VYPDINKWNTDRNDSKWDSVIQQGSSQAQSFGFTGTRPSWSRAEWPEGDRRLDDPDPQEIQSAIQQVS
jgi:hypothetical protein